MPAPVSGRRVDAAIVTEPELLPADMSFRVFCEERLVVVAHTIEAKLQEIGIQVNSQMEVDSLECVISLVANGRQRFSDELFNALEEEVAAGAGSNHPKCRVV